MTTGTFQGKTADEWRAMGRRRSQQRDESWERSDSDGFLTQWALGLASQEYHLKAKLADEGAFIERKAMFDLDGNLVPAVNGWSDFGEFWRLLDKDGNTLRFINPSKAKDPERKRANNAKKGFYVGTVRVPATVRTIAPAGAKGLSGATSVYVAIVPVSNQFQPDAEVVDNGQ